MAVEAAAAWPPARLRRPAPRSFPGTRRRPRRRSPPPSRPPLRAPPRRPTPLGRPPRLRRSAPPGRRARRSRRTPPVRPRPPPGPVVGRVRPGSLSASTRRRGDRRPCPRRRCCRRRARSRSRRRGGRASLPPPVGLFQEALRLPQRRPEGVERPAVDEPLTADPPPGQPPLPQVATHLLGRALQPSGGLGDANQISRFDRSLSVHAVLQS